MMDDDGTSTKALDLRQYIAYKVCIKVLLRRFVALILEEYFCCQGFRGLEVNIFI